VASFRATLAEAALAQVVVHLVDASHPDWPDQLAVGEEVLASLGVEPKGCIVVLNKVDRLGGALPPAPVDRNVIAISALTGEGMDSLRDRLRTAIPVPARAGDSPVSGRGRRGAAARLARRGRRRAPIHGEGIDLVVRRR